MTTLHATLIAWGAWILTWIAAAFWADRTVKRPPLREEWVYRVLTLTAFYLLLRPLGAHRLWAFGRALDGALFVLVLAGFAFAWAARLYLGRLWSSSVTRKADHRIVDAGPYALVRHPIYTGLLLAAAATAGQEGSARGLAGVALLALGFAIKARLEERFLSAELGAAAYEAYRRRVPMLIPFGPRG
jgi:protein-S-isoprenylcysteine O-methyltransferase Ste14